MVSVELDTLMRTCAIVLNLRDEEVSYAVNPHSVVLLKQMPVDMNLRGFEIMLLVVRVLEIQQRMGLWVYVINEP